jgi:molecular chaperone GrpE
VAEENKATPENEISEMPKAEDDIEILKCSLAEEKEKSTKYLCSWQRAEADFSNYKKRTEQEKSETTAFANWVLILNLLPILDDMERAIASLPPKLINLTWVDGILLIHRKLKALLESQGLAEIETTGKPFEPSIHEAVAHVEGEEGIIINEIQKGYMLKNKLLRPATVVVGKGKVEKTVDNLEEEKPQDMTCS